LPPFSFYGEENEKTMASTTKKSFVYKDEAHQSYSVYLGNGVYVAGYETSGLRLGGEDRAAGLNRRDAAHVVRVARDAGRGAWLVPDAKSERALCGMQRAAAVPMRMGRAA
jgi:hypothetical protein